MDPFSLQGRPAFFLPTVVTTFLYLHLDQGVQPVGVSGPPWTKKSCLGPHIKYTNTKYTNVLNTQTLMKTEKSRNILSKFIILCWAEFIAILGHRLDPLT